MSTPATTRALIVRFRSLFIMGRVTTDLITTAPFKLLHEHISVGAYDNSDEVDQTKCYPGTRTLLLKRLESWLAAPGNANRFITWLDGPMGSGKTAVARTMAERVSANNKLIGIFIFRRGQPGRNDEKRFITTLAYQMALSIPLARPFIEAEIQHDPSILEQSLYRQLEVLILEPLRQMRSQHPDIDVNTLPNLIIVDGLDECGADEGNGKEEKQTKVLDLLYRLALSQDILPFAILIHSRPESHIGGWFSADMRRSITNRFSLDASYRPDEDIRLFVNESFLYLLVSHPYKHLLPLNWPYQIDAYLGGEADNVIEIIVRRSSGQFIYAALVMKFIASQQHRPDKRLLSVLQLGLAYNTITQNSPHTIIDTLCIQILDSTNDHQTVRKVLTFNEAFRNTSVVPIDRILALLSISREDFDHCLQQLESLLTLRMAPFLKFHHSSLSEFLLDGVRSKHWFADLGQGWEFAGRAFKLFSNESYVGAQRSYLHVIETLIERVARHRRPPDDVCQDIEEWCNFLDSPLYAAPVMRFLEKTPLTTFFRATESVLRALQFSDRICGRLDIPLLRNTFLTHITKLIKPRIEKYLGSPDLFSHFLCRLFYIPCSNLANSVSKVSALNHRFYGDVRHMFNHLVLEWRLKVILRVFSIPSEEFLSDAFMIVLRHAGDPRVMFRRRRIAMIFPVLRILNVSLGLWLTILDYENYFTPSFRSRLHMELAISATMFKQIMLDQPCQCHGETILKTPSYGPVGQSDKDWTDNETWFLRHTRSSCQQILIPTVPALAHYMVYCMPQDEVLPVKSVNCACGGSCFEDIPLSLRI